MAATGTGSGTGEAVEAMVRLIALMASAQRPPLGEQSAMSARLLVADSLICGLAASDLDAAQMATAVFDNGGTSEAEAIGCRERIPAMQAAWINAEAMNLLDADDTFLNGSHFGSLISACAFAAAQRTASTWDQLIDAVTLAFELNARIALAVEDSSAEYFSPATMAPGAALAAVLAAGRPELALDAVGLSLRSAPGRVARRHALSGDDTVKYHPYGALAWQAQVSCQLAAAGHRARPWGYDGPDVFSLAGVHHMTPTPLSLPIGESWWITQTSLKPYPLYRLANPAIDVLRDLMARHPLSSSNIEGITVYLDPRALRLPFHASLPDRIPEGPTAPIRSARDVRYSLAFTVLGVPPGPQWSLPPAASDPAVWDMVGRITVSDQPAVPLGTPPLAPETDSGRVRASAARVEVRTADAVWSQLATVADGDPWEAATRPDWGWLRLKAKRFGVPEAVVDRIEQASGGEPVNDVFRS